MRKELSLPVYLYHQGTNYKAYELMGCHSGKRSNKKGYYFRVWAPSAQAVSLVGDFNGWDATADPMKKSTMKGYGRYSRTKLRKVTSINTGSRAVTGRS